ncbi:PfkB family carbohydrate kinase [Jiella avicenniae]|uniref:PfkB family carbohydrate kinase n=1 Tax=Jiella avicenniae TaxID=2907202 RepID=A0A9X1P4I0_9HYPH|nr:PfkB family carbohydrate kinase [Jiella avicenniae]MCE7030872.1 PfkB family carbohydrate kinase [Jiella avicenniae]
MSGEARPVIGFGALSVDDIHYVDAPLQAGKGRVLRRTRAFGGNVATALVAVARLGGAASFVGWLNASPDDEVVRELQASGVRIDDAPRAADCLPIRATITVGSDGDRFIAYDDDVRLGTTPDLGDAILTAAGALLIDGYAIGSSDVVRRARALDVPVVADIEWTAGAATETLLEMSDHLVLPLGFARRASGRERPRDVLEALWTDERSAVILTDGAEGAYLLEADRPPRHLPAHPVAVVDTTGAGDCFHGAYAHALVQGRGIGDCVRVAAAAAALSVGGRGGREALPSAGDVERLLSRVDAPEFRELASGTRWR